MHKLATFSLIAIVLSYIFGFVLSTFIPVVVNDPECTPTHEVGKQSKKSYTRGELDQAEAESQKRMDCLRNMDKQLSASAFMLKAREGGKWFSWLPWLAVPFLSKLRSYKVAIAPIGMLIALVALRVFLPIESLLSGFALIIGITLLRIKSASSINANAQPGG